MPKFPKCPTTNPKEDPPLVSVKVTNPITYIKRWWAKIIGNEGVEFYFRIRPLTAFIIAAIIAGAAFGVGGFVFSPPVASPTLTPTPAPEAWKETAFTGKLQFSQITNKYFLVTTTSAEAITLEVPDNINLEELVGKRIFASGQYNKSLRILKVADAKDMEVLPKTPVPIPTNSSTPIASPSPTPGETSPI